MVKGLSRSQSFFFFCLDGFLVFCIIELRYLLFSYVYAFRFRIDYRLGAAIWHANDAPMILKSSQCLLHLAPTDKLMSDQLPSDLLLSPSQRFAFLGCHALTIAILSHYVNKKDTARVSDAL